METKDFFGRFGDTVNKAAEATGKTARIVAEIAKLNYENVRKRDEMRKAYTSIGKTYVKLMGDDPDEEMCADVAAIYGAQAVIAENKVKIEALKAQLRPAAETGEEPEDCCEEEPEIEVEYVYEEETESAAEAEPDTSADE